MFLIREKSAVASVWDQKNLFCQFSVLCVALKISKFRRKKRFHSKWGSHSLSEPESDLHKLTHVNVVKDVSLNFCFWELNIVSTREQIRALWCSEKIKIGVVQMLRHLLIYYILDTLLHSPWVFIQGKFPAHFYII